jgi:hypothetical protein
LLEWQRLETATDKMRSQRVKDDALKNKSAFHQCHGRKKTSEALRRKRVVGFKQAFKFDEGLVVKNDRINLFDRDLPLL